MRGAQCELGSAGQFSAVVVMLGLGLRILCVCTRLHLCAHGCGVRWALHVIPNLSRSGWCWLPLGAARPHPTAGQGSENPAFRRLSQTAVGRGQHLLVPSPSHTGLCQNSVGFYQNEVFK